MGVGHARFYVTDGKDAWVQGEWNDVSRRSRVRFPDAWKVVTLAGKRDVGTTFQEVSSRSRSC